CENGGFDRFAGDGATTASDLEDVVDFQLEVGQTGKIRITIERLLFVPLLDFGELDNLVGNFIGEHADRMPGGQPKLWIIPIARKLRIASNSVFDRLLLLRWVHGSRKNLNEPNELIASVVLTRAVTMDELIVMRDALISVLV